MKNKFFTRLVFTINISISILQPTTAINDQLLIKTQPLMDKNAKIFVAGHRGLVGSAIVQTLTEFGYTTIITKTKTELDLENQQEVELFFATEKPEYVFLAAAKVGGIKANNDYPAEFIYKNLMIEANVIHSAYKNNVKKLLFLGSSCIYPRLCPQPIKEEYLLTSALEPTNEWYAIAKIAGLKLCEAYSKQYGANFISCMPTNLYGPNDNFDSMNSHVIPGLINKIYKAHSENQPSVQLWGTGKARREFLYVDDMAKACIFLMNYYTGDALINVGTGNDITIAELAHMIKKCIGYEGQLLFNADFPDGTPQKLLDVSKINALGWKAQEKLARGLEKAIDWYKKNIIKV